MTDFENTLNQLLSDPEQMEKLMGVAKSFMQSSDSDEKDSGGHEAKNAQRGQQMDLASMLSNLDPKIIRIVGKLMGEYNSGSDKETLIHAISPYLKEERRSQFERATEMAKFAKLARTAMNELGGKG